jgi:hypothetical protein
MFGSKTREIARLKAREVSLCAVARANNESLIKEQDKILKLKSRMKAAEQKLLDYGHAKEEEELLAKNLALPKDTVEVFLEKDGDTLDSVPVKAQQVRKGAGETIFSNFLEDGSEEIVACFQNSAIKGWCIVQ